VGIDHFKELKEFISQPIQVSIQGEDGEDQGPVVGKNLLKLEPCPDNTHMRIYFDRYYFIAIPYSSEIVWVNNEFQAFDHEGKLYYRIRKGC
jgi:hypothetical protein